MKQAIAIGLLLALGCGSVEDGQDEFSVPGNEPPEAEDRELPDGIGVTRQAFGAPLGYGFQKNNSGAACNSSTRCLVPRDKIMRPKCITNTTFAAGFTLCDVLSSEVGITGGLVSGTGWSISLTTGSSNEPVTSGTCPQGALACTELGNIAGQLFSQNGITYQQFNTCIIKVDKANIQADATYAAQADINKPNFVKGVIRHEFGHCIGLHHGSSGIMGGDHFGGFTSSELSNLTSYGP